MNEQFFYAQVKDRSNGQETDRFEIWSITPTATIDGAEVDFERSPMTRYLTMFRLSDAAHLTRMLNDRQLDIQPVYIHETPVLMEQATRAQYGLGNARRGIAFELHTVSSRLEKITCTYVDADDVSTLENVRQALAKICRRLNNLGSVEDVYYAVRVKPSPDPAMALIGGRSADASYLVLTPNHYLLERYDDPSGGDAYFPAYTLAQALNAPEKLRVSEQVVWEAAQCWDDEGHFNVFARVGSRTLTLPPVSRKNVEAILKVLNGQVEQNETTVEASIG